MNKLKFVIKDVDFADIYNNLVEEISKPVKIPKNIPFSTTDLFEKEYSDDHTQDVFQIKSKNNTQVFVNTNNRSSRCWSCKDPLNTDVSIGYPIQYKQHVELVDNVYNVVHNFYTEGSFCDMNCCYEYLVNESKTNYIKRDILLTNSKNYLKLLCKMVGFRLADNHDFRLKKEYGGVDDTLVDESRFKRTQRVIVQNCRVTYQQC